MARRKFTAGPWRAGRKDMGTIVDGYTSKWIYGPDDEYVAVASGRIRGRWPKVMANAHLIAAAPDLYEAVQALLPRGWRDGTMDHMRGVKVARLALAKAEGNTESEP